MKDILILLGSIVHELQKERACCCLYVGSDGVLFAREVREQFKLSDYEINVLESSLVRWRSQQILPPTSLLRLSQTRDKLLALSQKRYDILRLRLLPSEIIRIFSHELIYPLIGVSIELALFEKSHDTTKVSAYANFLRWKEHTGRERAIGIIGFLTHAFSNPQYVDWLQFQISEQTSLQTTFSNLVGDAQRRCLERFLNHDAEAEVQKFHSLLESGANAQQLQTMTAESWYRLLTQKIDLMLDSERQLIDTLQQHQDPVEDLPANDLSGSEEDIKEDDDEFVIRALPLFNGVPSMVIDELLKNKHIHNYSRGTMLIHELQPAKQIYIILSGWVKLFKNNPEGEESTLQMLSSGDVIGESQILLDEPYGENGEVVVNARILSFPADIINYQVLSCHQLAVNMLKDISRFSQNVLNLFKNTRLQTADNRIGWFLLKTVLDQGGIGKATYKLPFNKSIVASFLDMRPETLSRNLKRMKSNGLKFEKSNFHLLEPDTLCEFCDAHIARSCRLRNTSSCYKPKCAARYTSDS